MESLAMFYFQNSFWEFDRLKLSTWPHLKVVKPPLSSLLIKVWYCLRQSMHSQPNWWQVQPHQPLVNSHRLYLLLPHYFYQSISSQWSSGPSFSSPFWEECAQILCTPQAPLPPPHQHRPNSPLSQLWPWPHPVSSFWIAEVYMIVLAIIAVLLPVAPHLLSWFQALSCFLNLSWASHFSLTIHCWEAVLGCSQTIEAADNNDVRGFKFKRVVIVSLT